MWSVTVRSESGSAHRLQVEAADQQTAVSMVAEHFRRCGWRVLVRLNRGLVVSWDK